MDLRAGLAALLAAACMAGTARGADEEIQVYMDEMNRKGGFGLDVHLNDVLDGRLRDADYLGQMASQHRVRITPEFSYGLTPNLELGAYLPLFTIDPHDGAEFGGVKGRLKFIAPKAADSPYFWGVNFELGRVRRSLDINPWNAELKLIGGYRSGPWTLAANVNIDWAVSGPDKGPTTYEVATKLSYRVADDLALGIENYTDLGTARRFAHLDDGDQKLFLVADKSFGRWDLDIGVGHGFGHPEDRWIVKAIVGVPID
jgi:hypothetical protein